MFIRLFELTSVGLSNAEGHKIDIGEALRSMHVEMLFQGAICILVYLRL
jgi:hypothetical protein